MLRIERWLFNIFLAASLIVHLNYHLDIAHFSLIIPFVDVFLAFILILYLIRKYRYSDDNDTIIPEKKVIIIFILLLITMVVSIVKNYPRSDLNYLFLWIKYLVIFYYVYVNLGNTVKIEDIKKVLLFSILVQSVVCLVQYTTHSFWGCLPNYFGQAKFNITTAFEIGGVRGMRAVGTLPSPNILATFILIALLVAYIERKGLKSILFIALGALTVAMTLSRGIMMLMLLILLVVAISRKEKATIFLYIVSLFAVYYIFEIFELSEARLRFGKIPMGLRRLAGIQISLRLFEDNILWGIGFGGFRRLLERYHLYSLYGVRSGTVHNILLLYLTEGGIFVGLSIVLILYYLSKSCLKVLKKGGNEYSLSYATSLLVMIITLNTYLFVNVSNFIYLFAIISAIVCVDYMKKLVEDSVVVLEQQ